jgi:kynureninase
MDRLLAKQYLLTGYLEYLMDHLDCTETEGQKFVEIITPRDPRQRGTQLSVMFPFSVKEIHEKLEKRGVVVRGALHIIITFFSREKVSHIYGMNFFLN